MHVTRHCVTRLPAADFNTVSPSTPPPVALSLPLDVLRNLAAGNRFDIELLHIDTQLDSGKKG